VTQEDITPVEDLDAWPPSVEPQLRDVPVGIARTRAAHHDEPQIREVEKLTLDLLSSAREYAYVESQYFTASAVGERLAELLGNPAGAEIVLVLRKECDGWIQRLAMGENRDRLLRKLASVDRGCRLRTCYPIVMNEHGLAHEIDVHSKLMLVDDRLLKIGSSNLNNRSMGLDSELDLLIEVDDPASRRVLRSITCDLLAEHIDRSAEEVETAMATCGLIGALESLNDPRRRRLVPAQVNPEGPCEPVLGTSLVDPCDSTVEPPPVE
jgi:phosphatidylserine/phosphatidylglycerophosphate/cardiolipin synthase-like enzyme